MAAKMTQFCQNLQNRPHKAHFGSALDFVHLIWTKFRMDILLDPRNKHAKEFLIFLKIQNG